MNINIEPLDAYYDMWTSDASEIVLYGGSGSGKTYAAIDFMIVMGMRDPPRTFSVEMMSTDSAVKSDLFDATAARLDLLNIPHKDKHSSPYEILLPSGHKIIFVSAMQSKGSSASEGALKKHTDATRVFINEVSEIRERDYMMIGNRMGRSIRAKKAQRIVTFNPVFEDNWAVKKWVQPYLRGERVDNTLTIMTTYLDAIEVLSPEWVRRLLEDSERNPNYARVYRDGLPGTYEGLIYQEGLHYTIDLEWPEGLLLTTPSAVGVDWGSRHTAVVAVWVSGKDLYAYEILYEPGLIQSVINDRMNGIWDSHGWSKTKANMIRCDHEQDRIYELAHSGFMQEGEVWPAKKGEGAPHVCIPAYKDSVVLGIEQVMDYKVHIHPSSKNLIKEIRNYIWDPSTDERDLDRKPKKGFDHAVDALRYAIAHKPVRHAHPEPRQVKVTTRSRPTPSYGRSRR